MASGVIKKGEPTGWPSFNLHTLPGSLEVQHAGRSIAGFLENAGILCLLPRETKFLTF